MREGRRENDDMSPKRVRFEAMLFRSDSVRFESCASFRPAPDGLVCGCGWMEDDHPVANLRRELTTLRRLRRHGVRIPALRAS
jgi:hypothetical protein